MKEITFKRQYDLPAPQLTYTRAANKLLKEYKEVFHREPDDDVVEAAAKIKAHEAVEYIDYDHTFDYTAPGDEHGTGYTLKVTDEYHIIAGFDRDEYGEDVYYVEWYLFTTEQYTTRVGGKQIAARDHDEFMRKVYEARGKYRYFCVHRPPSLGCIPDGAVSFDTYPPAPTRRTSTTSFTANTRCALSAGGYTSTRARRAHPFRQWLLLCAPPRRR